MQMIIPLIIGIYYGVSRNMAGKEIDLVVAEGLGQSSIAIIMMKIIGDYLYLLFSKEKKTKIEEYISTNCSTYISRFKSKVSSI